MLKLQPRWYYRVIETDARHAPEIAYALEQIALLHAVTYRENYCATFTGDTSVTLWFSSDEAAIAMLRDLVAYLIVVGFDYTFAHKMYEGGSHDEP